MIWFIIVPIICGVAAYLITLNGYYTPTAKDLFANTVIWIVLGLFPATFVAVLAGQVLPTEERFQGQLEIVALADATHTEGRFYIFGGTIESEPVYRFYYESDGGYRMGWKPVGSSLIVESETETPRYERFEDVRDTDWWGLSANHNTRYIFYVPPGTVTNDFNLDLEG